MPACPSRGKPRLQTAKKGDQKGNRGAHGSRGWELACDFWRTAHFDDDSSLASSSCPASIEFVINPAELPATPLQTGRLWPLTVAAYRALGDAGVIPPQTELLYGFVYQKMSKSPLHSALVRRLLRLLQESVPPGHFVDTEQPITCENSEPEPDLAIIQGDAEDFWLQHPTTAELIIEVCVTSHDYDRAKLAAYATAGVKECWFILAPEAQIEVHRLPHSSRYTERMMYNIGETLETHSLPRLKLTLSTLFAR